MGDANVPEDMALGDSGGLGDEGAAEAPTLGADPDSEACGRQRCPRRVGAQRAQLLRVEGTVLKPPWTRFFLFS